MGPVGMSIELDEGDVSLQKTFTLEGKTPEGVVTAMFKPPKGERFVVMLLGSIPNGQELTREGVERMLDDIGFKRKDAE